MRLSLENIVLTFKGDRSSVAFKHIYDELSKPIFGLCKRYFSNIDDAHDALQETFISIFNKIDSYKELGSFEGWAKQIAINICLQKLRSNNKLLFVMDYNKVTDDVMDDSDPELLQTLENKNTELLQAFANLPIQYKTVLNLYVIENISHKEISELLQISVSNSKVLLNRAKALIKNKIEQNATKVNSI